MKRERHTKKKEMGMRSHGIISLLIFCIGASILNMRGNGHLPMSDGAKIATAIIFLGLLWIPLVRLYNSLFKSKK